MNLRCALGIAVILGCGIGLRGTEAAAPKKLNGSLVLSGSVAADYRFSPDGSWVVYRADQDVDGVMELYCAALTGGSVEKLNGSLVAGGDVASWQMTPNGDRIVYWADAEIDERTEVFIAPTTGGAAIKVNAPLLGVGSTMGATVGDRVVFVASEHTNAFLEPDYELFSVTGDGGAWERLSGTLVAAGDVRNVLARGDVGRVVYLADQDSDEVIELFSVPAGGGPATKLNGPLVSQGDVMPDGLQFSPDGSHVLYAADQEKNNVVEVFSVPTPGGTAVKLNGALVNGGNVTAGTQRFSSDSTRVLYLADQNTNDVFEIFSVASGGGTPVRLNGNLVASGDVRRDSLQFSPDGGRVLYIADQDTDEVIELFSVPSLGGTSVKLNGELIPGGDVVAADFSPDSSRVLYRADEEIDGVVELFSVPNAGGTPVRLNSTMTIGGNVVSAAFSPAGDRVVYLSDQDIASTFELYAVSALGGAALKISGPLVGGGDVIDWQFSPDGRSVVYRADQDIDGAFELYSVALDDDLPGDFNKDGLVDAADYTLWRDGLGGKYSAEDYTDWKANFGRSNRAGSAAVTSVGSAVPEPATWALFGSAIVTRIRRSRRRERIEC